MTFAEILASPFVLEIIIKALVVGTLVSLCAALLGVPLVLKRYSMIGDGLSHIGFGIAGIAAALGVSTDMSLEFSIPFVIVAAVLLLKISENSKIKGDAGCVQGCGRWEASGSTCAYYDFMFATLSFVLEEIS